MKLMSKFNLDGVEYDFSRLNEKCRHLVTQIQKVNDKSHEARNMVAVLTKAKRAYIAEIKSEILSAKAGFDFGTE